MKLVLLVIAAVLVCAAQQQQPPVYTDITKASGITFKHSYGDRHQGNIVEGTGAGMCIFGYDNDGWLDIFITYADAHHEYVQESTLMRNKGTASSRTYRAARVGTPSKNTWAGAPRGAIWTTTATLTW